jgi:acyl-CoA synthetase (AMP-forming)/AMP-acid ligase II
MNRDERDAVTGEEGELYVSGGSVMKGYWNLAERTAQAFMTEEDGTRWYRTGDVVRDSGDGLFEFLGRRDRMVKRRGYRVELGEIEMALYQHPNINEAAVVAVPDDSDGIHIRAFVAWTAGARPSLIDIKGFCSQNLPLYMIPDQFVFESSLPKTSTDKIDYQKLMESSLTRTSAAEN